MLLIPFVPNSMKFLKYENLIYNVKKFLLKIFRAINGKGLWLTLVCLWMLAKC